MNACAWIAVAVIATWLAGCSETHPPLESSAQIQTIPEQPDDADPQGDAHPDADVDDAPPVVDDPPDDSDAPNDHSPSEQPNESTDEEDDVVHPISRIPENYDNGCEVSGAFEPLVVRAGETCYDLRAHNGNGVDPFEVQPDESMNQLYYEIPWGEDQVATRYGGDYDNIGVLHRWLLFASDQGTPGTVDRNVTGTTMGTNAQLLAGWAQGGCNVEFPEDFGLELPGPSTGKTLMIQWQHLNLTGTAQPDATGVQICTVPRSERAHIGSITWLGTEDLNGLTGMPPGVESTFTSRCINDADEPITLVALWPHMHQLGTEVALDAIGVDGSTRPILTRTYAFDYNQHYYVNASLQPGEQVRTSCTYFNSTAYSVGFGQSVIQEMCFMFAFSYPAHALDNGVISLWGATNTCW